MSNVAHWACWGSHGELEHGNKPVPHSTPEAAMDQLLSKARFVFGDQPWQKWQWEAREYGTRESRVIRFRYEGGAIGGRGLWRGEHRMPFVLNAPSRGGPEDLTDARFARRGALGVDDGALQLRRRH